MITDYSKQINLIDVSTFNKRINIIGCGATGSWLTFFLLKMGFKNIHVYDYDVIEEHNIPNQMFKESQIGNTKVDSIKKIYKSFFNDEDELKRLTIHNTKITENNANALTDVVFCCVDDMLARKYIYEMCFKYGMTEYYSESRISIYGAYLYSLSKESSKEDREWYEGRFYENEDAEVSHCGVSQTALPASINVVTIMIMNMIGWFTENKFNRRIEYSIPDLIAFVE